MTIALADLIEALKQSAPEGVEIPRSGAQNAADETTIGRWASDAAQMINERRGKTTLKETTITMVADQQEYSLPSDCRRVESIRRQHASVRRNEVLGVPNQGRAFGAFGTFGILPTGQNVQRSVEMLQNLDLDRLQDEDEYELIGGQIRFLFPSLAGEGIVVRYHAIDRSFADVGDDRFSMILDYLQWSNLDWWLGKRGAPIAQNGDSFGAQLVSSVFRRMMDIKERWLSALNSIGPEAN